MMSGGQREWRGAGPLVDCGPRWRHLVPGAARAEARGHVGTKEIGWRGTYQVYRDTLKITEDGTIHPFTLAWSLSGSTLALSNLQNGHCDDEAVWAHAWTKKN